MISEMSLGEYMKKSKSSRRSKPDHHHGHKPAVSHQTNRRLTHRTGAPKPHSPKRPVESAPPKLSRKLLEVTNLPTRVTNDELSLLFSKLGVLSRCNVLYDALGKSKVR